MLSMKKGLYSRSTTLLIIMCNHKYNGEYGLKLKDNIKYLVVTHFLLSFQIQGKILLHNLIIIDLEKTIDNRIQKEEGM